MVRPPSTQPSDVGLAAPSGLVQNCSDLPAGTGAIGPAGINRNCPPRVALTIQPVAPSLGACSTARKRGAGSAGSAGVLMPSAVASNTEAANAPLPIHCQRLRRCQTGSFAAGTTASARVTGGGASFCAIAGHSVPRGSSGVMRFTRPSRRSCQK